ncbi:MAG: zinc ribbon domain-containing protein [Desulfovibrio sp.]|nr:zinc ribbon domain-containing protein [Desulfovibrio sp.]
MPLYEYICKKCGLEFEELVFGGVTPTCPNCGLDKTRRLMSRSARYPSRGSAGEGEEGYGASSPGSGGCAGCSGGNCANCGH